MGNNTKAKIPNMLETVHFMPPQPACKGAKITCDWVRLIKFNKKFDLT